MSRLRMAFERFWRDGAAVQGFVETLLGWPLRLRRDALTGASPPVRGLEDVRRILVWLSSPLIARRPGTSADLLGQIRRGYAMANEDVRRLIREELAAHLTDPADPVVRHVLALARDIPLPEARQALLDLLTRPIRHAAVDPDGAVSPVDAVEHDARADLVAALAALRDPALGSLFRHLLAKFSEGMRSDPHALEIGREAALGLWRLNPDDLPAVLPEALRADPLLGDRIDAADDAALGGKKEQASAG